MELCRLLLLLILGLVAGRPEPGLQITVKELVTVNEPEVTKGFYEGDIELPKFRNAIRNLNDRWPNGIVYYSISSSFSSTEKATIIEAMREIESNTKHGTTYCVRFVERTTQHDYVNIQQNNGCHSKIGRVGGAQELSLAEGCYGRGTVMHELIHALGFWHEQNRYDRDSYITVHTDNIAAEHSHDFTKQTSTEMNTQDSPYDYGSIMHYGAYTFSMDKSRPSLSPKGGNTVGIILGQRLAMSIRDVERIQTLYRCTVDTSHITHPASTQSVFKCNFDTDFCGLRQDSQDNFQWSRKSGSTDTTNTGPNADHTNSAGSYIYAEANGHHNQKARLMTSSTTAGQYCIDYWLFQHGSEEGSFELRATGSRIPEQVVQSFKGNQPNEWQHFRLDLNVPASFYLILQATIGAGDHSDIAIDDFNFYHGKCV